MDVMMVALPPTAEAYAELQTAFDHYNVELFDGTLPHCLITMQREKRTYGYFSSERFVHRQHKTKTDEIAMNPAYFAVVPLREVLQTLVHEMCHLWQFHHGAPGRRGYHNKEWADKMEAIGLMPSNTGKPGGRRTGEKMEDYGIENGPFMAATETLLKRNFNVSWLDRLPAALRQAIADESDEIAAPAESNRSNRVKFRCPACNAQAWGKPTLRLLCGGDDCNAVALEPTQ